MATDKPRITITLDPKVYVALKAFSEVTEQPMSGFISTVIAESLPVIKRLTALAVQAKNATPAAMSSIKQNVAQLLDTVEGVRNDAEQAVDMYTSAPHDEPRQGELEGVSAPASPPISNRGGQNSVDRGAKAPKADIKPAKVTRLKDHRRAR